VDVSPTEIPNPLPYEAAGFKPFAFAETDLASLAAVKLAARRAFDSGSAAIAGMTARKPEEANSVRWRVELQEPNGRRGWVDVGTNGEVLGISRPEAARPGTD
jgi:hypothetical protein